MTALGQLDREGIAIPSPPWVVHRDDRPLRKDPA